MERTKERIKEEERRKADMRRREEERRRRNEERGRKKEESIFRLRLKSETEFPQLGADLKREEAQRSDTASTTNILECE